MTVAITLCLLVSGASERLRDSTYGGSARVVVLPSQPALAPESLALAYAIPRIRSRAWSHFAGDMNGCGTGHAAGRDELKLTEGQAHDGRSADGLLGRPEDGDVLSADRAYDGDAMCAKSSE